MGNSQGWRRGSNWHPFLGHFLVYLWLRCLFQNTSMGPHCQNSDCVPFHEYFPFLSYPGCCNRQSNYMVPLYLGLGVMRTYRSYQRSYVGETMSVSGRPMIALYVHHFKKLGWKPAAGLESIHHCIVFFCCCCFPHTQDSLLKKLQMLF